MIDLKEALVLGVVFAAVLLLIIAVTLWTRGLI